MAETKTKKAGGGKTPAKDYIDHEHIDTPATEQVKVEEADVEAEEIQPDKQIKLEVAKLNLADTAIAELKKQYGDLTINGVDDKAGYKAVKAAWSEVRSIRTGLEKRGLAIRNRIAQITKAVSKEEDRLIDLLAPLEEELQKKYRAIDDEKVRVEKEAQEKEQQRLMQRLEELVGMGMRLTDGFYRIGDTISMDVATLRALPDEQYQKLKDTVQAKATEIADQQRLKDEEDKRERERVKAEQDKLKADQERLEQDRRQMIADRREVRLGKLENLGMELQEGPTEFMIFDTLAINVDEALGMEANAWSKLLLETTNAIKERKDRISKAKAKADRANDYTNRLGELGMVWKGDKFIYDNDFNEPLTAPAALIFEMTEEHFKEYATSAKANIEAMDKSKADHDKEVAEEKRILEDKKRFISATMERAGLNFSYTAQEFYWEDRNKTIKLGWNDLLALSEPAISDIATSLEAEILAAKHFTEEQNQKQAEKNKKDKMLGMKDKERWEHAMKDIQAAVANVKPGDFKTQVYQNKATNLLNRLSTYLKEFK